jgi:hypothetical protein
MKTIPTVPITLRSIAVSFSPAEHKALAHAANQLGISTDAFVNQAAAEMLARAAAQPAESGVYWTLKRSGQIPEHTQAAWKLKPIERFPHSGLTNHQCASPKLLLEILLKLGWKESAFTNSDDQFARIQITPRGFNVVCFASYAAALADYEAGRSLAGIPQDH